MLQFFKDLLDNQDTATLAAWYLFDPIAKALGIQSTVEELLEPILRLYERHDWEDDRNLSSLYRTKKSVKLYHHSFLLKLIVRFGLKCFLENFATRLIEAVGGCRDIEQDCQPKHVHRKSSTKRILKPPDTHADDQNVFAFDEDNKQHNSESESVLDLHLNHSQAEEATEADFLECKFGDDNVLAKDITLVITADDAGFKRTRSRKSRSSGTNCTSRISDMSSDSLIWLAHRLGPVLTARHLSRNLLKMLSLCYLGEESLKPKAETAGHMLDVEIAGDEYARRVLDCLMSIAGMFISKLH